MISNHKNDSPKLAPPWFWGKEKLPRSISMMKWVFIYILLGPFIILSSAFHLEVFSGGIKGGPRPSSIDMYYLSDSGFVMYGFIFLPLIFITVSRYYKALSELFSTKCWDNWLNSKEVIESVIGQANNEMEKNKYIYFSIGVALIVLALPVTWLLDEYRGWCEYSKGHFSLLGYYFISFLEIYTYLTARILFNVLICGKSLLAMLSSMEDSGSKLRFCYSCPRSSSFLWPIGVAGMWLSIVVFLVAIWILVAIVTMDPVFRNQNWSVAYIVLFTLCFLIIGISTWRVYFVRPHQVIRKAKYILLESISDTITHTMDEVRLQPYYAAKEGFLRKDELAEATEKSTYINSMYASVETLPTWPFSLPKMAATAWVVFSPVLMPILSKAVVMLVVNP